MTENNKKQNNSKNKKQQNLQEVALHYHSVPIAGKLEVTASKPLITQYDLSLAYSPGVAQPCLEIQKDNDRAADYTTKNNLVAVISNGTAVLGLGDIGALASKPVMEGKAVLFKKFGGVNSFDIEIDEKDPKKFIEIVSALEPTFGGINLEDIKAPDCFEIEEELSKIMKIPVFHDDQHGTAITTAAAVINALLIVRKEIEAIKVVVNGAGAAAIACLNQLVDLGAKKKNIYLCDSKGLVIESRKDINIYKRAYAQNSAPKNLQNVIKDCDLFLGLSKGNQLSKEMVSSMASQPIIFAMANPVPEIFPHQAKEARGDAIVATGRSDFPNQVNNVLCFPYIFRGALDVGATTINKEMKIACVHAIASIARMPPTAETLAAYSANEIFTFGAEYFIPKIFDSRLMIEIPYAVAKSAIETGVAGKNIDLFEYKERLISKTERTDAALKNVINQARNISKKNKKRIIFANSNISKILRAVQIVVDDQIAYPILIGNKSEILRSIKRYNLNIKIEKDFDVINPVKNKHSKKIWQEYYKLMSRHGYSPEQSKFRVKSNPTILGALLVRLKLADGLICGAFGNFKTHIRYLKDIVDYKLGVIKPSALQVIITPERTLYICDTHVISDPTPEEICTMTLQATNYMKGHGVSPKVALLSHSNFGDWENNTSIKMRRAVELIKATNPDFEIDGEMQADAALVPRIRESRLPNSSLKGEANLLIMPNLEAANITFNVIKSQKNSVYFGPVLLGVKQPIYVLTASATVRNIFNLCALAVVESNKNS